MANSWLKINEKRPSVILATLKPIQRKVFVERVVDEMEFSEIARRHRITEEEAETTYDYALSAVKIMMPGRGGYFENPEFDLEKIRNALIRGRNPECEDVDTQDVYGKPHEMRARNTSDGDHPSSTIYDEFDDYDDMPWE